MEQVWNSGRMWRLCQKELRETLRDRRTIITLIVMPILLYPLLSIAMQRVFLSSFQNRGETTYTIGVATTEERDMLGTAIQGGRKLAAQRPYQPIRIHRSLGRIEGQQDGKEEVIGAEPDDALIDIQVFETQLDRLLKDGTIDLVVEAKPLTSSNERRDFQRYRFRSSYRQGDRYSEEALRQVQRLMQVINDVDIDNRAVSQGKKPEGAVELIAEPIRMAAEGSAGLTTLIPLVLLLMTITGAVYPAIDLTAGERERGTMESLIASPVPRFALLLSKYVAVMTVAVLTAIANLFSMWITLYVTNIGKQLLGADGMSFSMMLQILPLLIVFACFFSAVLLALCSFAKSFKEAQAYLIPVMLISLAPGILSLLPGIEFTNWLAVVPLLNMVLLARDILVGSVALVPAVTSVISTVVYAAAALSIASKLFGADATTQGGSGSWSDLWRRPEQPKALPELGQLFILLALLYPVYFISSNLLGQVKDVGILQRGWYNAGLTFALFLLFPLAFSTNRKLEFKETFRWKLNSFRIIPTVLGIALLGVSMWMVAHELFLFSKFIGIATISKEQLEMAEKAKQELIASGSLLSIVLAMAVVPAIAEEFFFRGFVLSSLHRSSAIRQIVISGLLFGVFHVISSNVFSIERLLPTAFLGLVLGWIAWKTRSLFPGIALHALHNGLMFTLAYHSDWLTENGWGIEEQSQLPVKWLIAGGICLALGAFCIRFSRKPSNS